MDGSEEFEYLADAKREILAWVEQVCSCRVPCLTW